MRSCLCGLIAAASLHCGPSKTGGEGPGPGGTDWVQTTSVDANDDVQALASAGGRLFLGDAAGVSSSADGNTGWVVSNTGMNATPGIFALVADGTDVLAATDDIYRSKWA